jgi:general secretion pathway protein H
MRPSLDRPCPPPATRRRAVARGGFSLIELMVVIVIMALAAAGMTRSIGALTRTKMRSAAMEIVAASRFAYGRSVSQGTTVRISFDLAQGSIQVQEAHGRVTLARGDDALRNSLDEGGEGDGASVDPWAAAKSRLEEPLAPTFGRSPFGAVTNDDGEAYKMSTARPLGEGIKVARLLTPHDPAPLTEGNGAIYFFPGGQSEHAVVQLENADGEVFSVEIAPLTGRARVYAFAYEPESLSEDDELRDPG